MIQLSFSDLSKATVTVDARRQNSGEVQSIDIENQDSNEHEFLESIVTKTSDLGTITNGNTKHFYTRGAFDLVDLVDLVFYVIKQTGHAHIFVSSYGIAIDTIKQLKRRVQTGSVLSVRFLLDNRVKSISPKPFDAMVRAFPGQYRLNSVHAKCALIWNDQWKISIIGSQNATHNPKLERDTIYTDERVFRFDLANLERAFSEGQT